MGRGDYWLAACAALLGCACNESSVNPSLVSVSPDRIMAGEETVLRLRTEDIYPDIRVDLNGDQAPSVNSRFSVRIGDQNVQEVSYLDSSELTVIAPSNLAVGVYDLRLVTPDGPRPRLTDALEVVAVLSSADAGIAEDGGAFVSDAGVPGPPVSNFSDDFEDDVIGPEWTLDTSPTGCSANESGGAIRFQMDGSSASRCEITTVDGYDLRGLASSIHVPPITNFYPELSCFLRISNDAGDSVEYGFRNDELYLNIEENSAQTFTGSTSYNSSINYWRIRESAGELFLESSVDLSSWQLELQQSAPFSVEHVHVSVGVSTSGPMGGSVGISVLSYNSLP